MYFARGGLLDFPYAYYRCVLAYVQKVLLPRRIDYAVPYSFCDFLAYGISFAALLPYETEASFSKALSLSFGETPKSVN